MKNKHTHLDDQMLCKTVINMLKLINDLALLIQSYHMRPTVLVCQDVFLLFEMLDHYFHRRSFDLDFQNH